MDNISLGHPEVKLEDVVWAADCAGLSEFVQRLPKGYQTILLPEGKNIPQHIRSKILLARSIASRPRLLVLENMTWVMEQSDRDRIAAFLTSREHRWTLLASTDDPVFAAHCDRVMIMDAGKIVANGSFETIRESPHFSKVFKTGQTLD